MTKKSRKNRAKRRRRKIAHQPQGRSWQKTAAVGAVVAVMLFAGLLLTRPSAPAADAAVLADEPALGPATAPVTIVEYGDFGCPACAAWHRAGIREQVLAQYGDQVRFVWRDFPVITRLSPKASEAAQCAHDQGMFWAYHDLLFERAPAIREGDLKAYAVELGLDTDLFNQCLDAGQHRATVDQDLRDARSRRLRGTPSFVVNGQQLPAPPSFGFLQEVIEAELGTRQPSSRLLFPIIQFGFDT
jgi:protein-disulfide isomerase